MLDNNIKTTLIESFKKMKNDVYINYNLDDSEASNNFKDILFEIIKFTNKIHIFNTNIERKNSFSVSNNLEYARIYFSCLPTGNEFTSFVLSILYLGGVPSKIKKNVEMQIESINKCFFEIYINSSCPNCPEVVQSLILIAALNENVQLNIIDINLFTEESKYKNITSIPTIYLNNEIFHIGRLSLDKLLEKIVNKLNLTSAKLYKENELDKNIYDVLIIGGGPAGVSSAIYSARKGLKVCLIAYELGGQILETAGIENFIGTKYTEGLKLKEEFKNHIEDYPNIEIIEGHKVIDVKKYMNLYESCLENKIKLISKTMILCTGAVWKKINIPGENEFKSKGISYCTHCDGPLFRNKEVIVIGGGNSGMEAALDLSNIASKITVLEYMPKLKADKIIQDKVKTKSNIEIIKNAQITHIDGEDVVESVRYLDKLTGETKTIKTQGVFPLIGLQPNTKIFEGFVNLDKYGQIIVDKNNKTNLEGVYAAGDCTNNLYKQIVISIGEGANAALSLNDYLMLKNII